MSATLLLMAANKYADDIETYNDRKRKWFDALDDTKKEEILHAVQHMCEVTNVQEEKDYEFDMKLYVKMLKQYNDMPFIFRWLSSKPKEPIKPVPIECHTFWDNGWNIMWNQYGLGYPGN